MIQNISLVVRYKEVPSCFVWVDGRSGVLGGARCCGHDVRRVRRGGLYIAALNAPGGLAANCFSGMLVLG